jgi:hypothetical protein
MDRPRAAALFRGDRDLAQLLPAADDLDAVDGGYVARETVAGFGLIVTVTEDGEKLLREHGRVG